MFQTRLAYLKYMTKVGKLLGGGDDTTEQMAKVLELEGMIAKVRKLSSHSLGILPVSLLS